MIKASRTQTPPCRTSRSTRQLIKGSISPSGSCSSHHQVPQRCCCRLRNASVRAPRLCLCARGWDKADGDCSKAEPGKVCLAPSLLGAHRQVPQTPLLCQHRIRRLPGHSSQEALTRPMARLQQPSKGWSSLYRKLGAWFQHKVLPERS